MIVTENTISVSFHQEEIEILQKIFQVAHTALEASMRQGNANDFGGQSRSQMELLIRYLDIYSPVLDQKVERIDAKKGFSLYPKTV